MSSRRRCPLIRGVLLLLPLMVLAACGGEIPEPSPDGIAGSAGDPCRLLSQQEAGRIMRRADVPAGVSASADECSFNTEDGKASLVYDVEDRKLFNLALGEAKSSRATIAPVTGLGDEAFFYTPRSSTSGPGGAPITYLKVHKRDRYFTTLVRRDDKYDLDMEKQVAQRLLGGS